MRPIRVASRTYLYHKTMIYAAARPFYLDGEPWFFFLLLANKGFCFEPPFRNPSRTPNYIGVQSPEILSQAKISSADNFNWMKNIKYNWYKNYPKKLWGRDFVAGLKNYEMTQIDYPEILPKSR